MYPDGLTLFSMEKVVSFFSATEDPVHSLG